MSQKKKEPFEIYADAHIRPELTVNIAQIITSSKHPYARYVIETAFRNGVSYPVYVRDDALYVYEFTHCKGRVAFGGGDGSVVDYSPKNSIIKQIDNKIYIAFGGEKINGRIPMLDYTEEQWRAAASNGLFLMPTMEEFLQKENITREDAKRNSIKLFTEFYPIKQSKTDFDGELPVVDGKDIDGSNPLLNK